MKRIIVLCALVLAGLAASASGPGQAVAEYCDGIDPTVHTDSGFSFDGLAGLLGVEDAQACAGGVQWDHIYDYCLPGDWLGHPEWLQWCENPYLGWHGHNYY